MARTCRTHIITTAESYFYKYTYLRACEEHCWCSVVLRFCRI